jgi:hypothetical protein
MEKSRLLKETIVDLIQDIKTHILKDPWKRIEFSTMSQVVCALDQTLLYKKVSEKILPMRDIYSEQIKTKNENFFLQDNSIVFKEKEFLKSVWLSSTAEDKEILWSYFAVILKLVC